MTPRERVLAAIDHREPDRVPVDLGGTPSSGISAIAYNNLVKYEKLDTGPALVYDVVQQFAQPDWPVLDRLGVDVVDIGRTFNSAPSDWYDYELLDGSTGRYPRWFQPHRNEDGSWIAETADGLPIAKMAATGTFLHCCGSIRKLIPDLIEAGYDILNPVQTNCMGMDPAELKRDFGADITFWGGGCDTRHVLNNATPDEVRTHVLERLEIFAPGGGFVFNTVHNILPEIRPENVLAMFEALDQFHGR